MGTIEIQQKLDEFKIRLKILGFQERLNNSNCGKVVIKDQLREIEIEFDEFIEKTNE